MMPLKHIAMVLLKGFLLVLLAPLVSGIIRKAKNNLRMRVGPGVLQPYYDLRKLFLKGEVISENCSWVFCAAPAVVFISGVCASFLVLMMDPGNPAGDNAAILIAAFFVLGLGRFFLALGGLDAGSSFGGMGSSREMFISSFAEPAAFVAAFALCMAGGEGLRLSKLLAGSAVLIVAIAETSRIPVDNQETHLELTMVHEAMALEYSGRSLALIELAGHIKQLVFFIIISLYFFWPGTAAGLGWMLLPVKIGIISLVIALIEISVAKMRLFRVVDFLSFSFFMALLASVLAGLGF